MNALKTSNEFPSGKNWVKGNQQISTSISSSYSFSLLPSLGEKAQTAQSPPHLRRSTVNLSQTGFAGHSHVSQLSLHGAEHSADGTYRIRQQRTAKWNNVNGSIENAILQYMSLLHSIVLVKAGIRMLLDEAKHYVGNVVGFLLDSIFAKNVNGLYEDLVPEDILHSNTTPHVQSDDQTPDPPLSPARLTRATSTDSKDEWGHFADFQEELADKQSFIPSYVRKRSSLETLDEDSDYECSKEAFSF